VNDWDDAQDRAYWRGVTGPDTSDYSRMIWRRDRERLNPSEPEPSIADLPSSPGGMHGVQQSPAQQRWADLAQAHREDVSSAIAGRQTTPSVPVRAQKHPSRAIGAGIKEPGRTSENLRTSPRLCKVCSEPLPLDAAKWRKQHDKCGRRVKMRNYRAKKKAAARETRLSGKSVTGEEE
jgi:hypothetical protein